MLNTFSDRIRNGTNTKKLYTLSYVSLNMRTNRFNLITILRAIEIVERTNNVKATAKEFEVWPSQIRKWRLARDGWYRL